MFPSGTPVPLTLFETVSYSPLVVTYFLDSRILVTNRRTSLKDGISYRESPEEQSTHLGVRAETESWILIHQIGWYS
jgi:hypothetical protein